MNFLEASLVILLMATLSVPLAERFKFPLELFLFLGSCIISMVATPISISIDPVIIFDLFLPPILFSAAYFTSWKDFKFNIRAITQLALGLVLFTTAVVAITAKLVLPGFSWAEAFLLGAIISPTDASAATSIIRKLGVPRRLIILLEGESLVNDASALILYKFSLGAILYGTFSLPVALVQFSFLTIGGFFVGFILAYLAVRILKKIRNIQAETVFTFLSAFASYLIAERLGFSGVIATVTAGIYFGIMLPESATAHTRMHATATWKSILFIINGFAFTLLGFQMPLVIKAVASYSILHLLWYGTAISIAVIAIRLIWIYPSAYIPRKLFRSIAVKDPMPSWQLLFGIGWVGMRGIVSLAAVLAIPITEASLIPGSHLHLLIFITYFVIATTLVIPTLTMPFLVKILKLKDAEDHFKEEALGRIQMIENAITACKAFATEQHFPPMILEEFIQQYQKKHQMIEAQLSDVPYSAISDTYFIFRRLFRKAIQAERATLLQLRKNGDIHDGIFWSLSEELDIEEMRMKNRLI